MKRSNHDREAFIKAKEPRLEVEDTTTSSSSSSSAARDRPESHNNSSDSSSIETSSVRKALRRSLELKKERTLLQASSEESILKKITEGDERLREWSQVVSSAGYFCEVRSLTSDLSPFPESLVEEEPTGRDPRFALLIHPSKHLMFDNSTGPFQAVHLIIFPEGEWRLDSPICEHRVITSGTFSLTESKAVPKEVLELPKMHLSDKHVLCPGLVGVDDLQGELGYFPKRVTLINAPVSTVHSKTCKIWHIPARKGNPKPLSWTQDIRECVANV